MNNQWLMRTRTLLGDPAMEQLQNATVAILGLGGVGVLPPKRSAAWVWDG